MGQVLFNQFPIGENDSAGNPFSQVMVVGLQNELPVQREADLAAFLIPSSLEIKRL